MTRTHRTATLAATLALLLLAPGATADPEAEGGFDSFRYVTNAYWDTAHTAPCIGGLDPSGCVACGPTLGGAECSFASGDGFTGTFELQLLDRVLPEVLVHWSATTWTGETCAGGVGVNGFHVELPDGCGFITIRIGNEATFGEGAYHWG